jgi:hypothetical protein
VREAHFPKTRQARILSTIANVVRTNDGSRLLYAEESAEIWLTDYGFDQLENGVAVVPIDAVFAHTVNLEAPYHVFVQVYGDGEVSVSQRSSGSFQVNLWDGDPNVRFSYRLVAKRLGYEDQRLERAAVADVSPILYPEKRAEWEAKHHLWESLLPHDSELPEVKPVEPEPPEELPEAPELSLKEEPPEPPRAEEPEPPVEGP